MAHVSNKQAVTTYNGEGTGGAIGKHFQEVLARRPQKSQLLDAEEDLNISTK